MSRHSPQQVRAYNSTKSSCLGERIRVADTAISRMVGLLSVSVLAPGDGLLILPSQAVHTVGMRFPIDVLFVDKLYRVVGMRERLRPYRVTRVFWGALGVLELPGGTVALTRTEIGDQLDIRLVAPASTA